MIKGKTGSGFEWEIEDNAANDWETVELLSEADDGKTSSLIKAIKRIFGDDGYSALKEHVRNKKGVVATDQMIVEIREFMESTKEGKNS